MEITGTVTRQWGRAYPGETCEVELTLLGNSLHVQNKERNAVDLTPSVKCFFADFWKSSAGTPLTFRNQIVSRWRTSNSSTLLESKFLLADDTR